jgi:thiosulfate reductase cytochrome b subunit
MRFGLTIAALALVASGMAMYLMPPIVPDDKLEGVRKWAPVCIYVAALLIGAFFILMGVQHPMGDAKWRVISMRSSYLRV